jgi:hypothetical protein
MNNSYAKDQMRVNDIVRKAGGDRNKEILLAQTQANRITHSDKAYSRSTVASMLGHPHIAQVFKDRYNTIICPRTDKIDFLLDIMNKEH